MDFAGNQPIYLQIGDYICENIVLEKWQEGEKIPSIRDFAVTLELNPNTVMRTYSFLQNKGIIENQRGIGYFVSENAWRRTKEMKKHEFIEKDLPAFFKTLQLLDMKLEDLTPYFEEYTKEEKEKEKV